MGPCPFRHGYAGWLLFFATTLIASMGPCPFRHGYEYTAREKHAFTSASMGPCPFRHGYMYTEGHGRYRSGKLQWGHALSGMDISILSAMSFSFILLQWGHALSGMDIIRACPHPADACPASMGPCPFRHGYDGSDDLGCGVSVYASMGPCPFRHGYLISRGVQI